MQTKIEIIKVENTNTGKYGKAVLTYKGTDGQIKSHSVMSFNTHVYKVMSQAQAGEVYDIEMRKDEKTGYWAMYSAVKSGEGMSQNTAVPANKQATKSTYETPEERAMRQVYIVRQSSISNALEFAKLGKMKDVSVEGILSVAKEFEAYVFEKGDIQDGE